MLTLKHQVEREQSACRFNRTLASFAWWKTLVADPLFVQGHLAKTPHLLLAIYCFMCVFPDILLSVFPPKSSFCHMRSFVLPCKSLQPQTSTIFIYARSLFRYDRSQHDELPDYYLTCICDPYVPLPSTPSPRPTFQSAHTLFLVLWWLLRFCWLQCGRQWKGGGGKGDAFAWISAVALYMSYMKISIWSQTFTTNPSLSSSLIGRG